MFRSAKVRLLAGAFLAFVLICASGSTLLAQGTGQITGKIIDKKTGTALGFANIVIVGSRKGAMSLDDGKFTVPGIPVGTYTVKAMMMGYKTIELPGIVVNSNQTTEISFSLGPFSRWA